MKSAEAVSQRQGMERSKFSEIFISCGHIVTTSRIEVAVKQILSGLDVKTNASVANPEALEWFKEWAKTH